jgi:serine/threonine protein kinase
MPSIGKYEILEQLGSGSMGTVHKGRDTLLDRMVALKMIRTGVNIELEAKERFYREARTCARLSHPHIVSVYDLGEENGTSFIAMELLKGYDFRQLIERREQFQLQVKLIAMAQICEGLAHAHREGVIHRDIKPSNLFLLGDGRAKIVDFGIAKLPTSHLTRSGAVLGTPNYMAPEQIQGLNCDGRADLFSAGICFFEFLTYQHPFKSNLIPQRILEDKPDTLFQYDATLPRILERIFTRALAKKPEDRYATGDEFAADLRAVVDAIGLNASPSFSKVDLPSASSFAVPPRIPLSETEQIRAGSGVSGLGAPGAPPADWRADRIQQLLPALDHQVANRDLVGARSSLAELQSVAGLDPRFRSALEHYRGLVNELAGVGMRGSQSGLQAPAAVSCPKCGALNRPAAAFCVTCGGAIAAAAAPVTGVQAAVAPTAPKPVPPQPVAAQPVAAQPKPAAAPGKGFAADKTRLALVAGLIVIVAIVLIVLPNFFRKVKEEPFVASARVAAQQIALHDGPAASGKDVASVQRSTLVHVLSLPKSLSTGWVQVQARDGDGYTKAGYAQTKDLIEWESKDPKIALTLARMSGPMKNGTDAEMRSQIDRLTSVAATFSGKPEANAAAFDAARLQFILTKHSKDANPTGDWPTALTDLSSRLEPLRSDSTLQPGVDNLLKEVQELLASAPKQPGTVAGAAGAAPSGPPTEDDIKKWLASADWFRTNHQYNNAKAFVARVLQANPGNAQAQDLLKRINAAIELENSIK